MAKTMSEEMKAHLAGEFPQVPVNVYLRQPAPYDSLLEINEILAGKYPGRTVSFIPPGTVVQLEVLSAIVQGEGLRRGDDGQYAGRAAILEGSRPALGSTSDTARWSVRKVLALPSSAAAVPAQPEEYDPATGTTRPVSAGSPEPIEGWSQVDGHRYVRPVKAVSSGTISLGVDLPPDSGGARVGAGPSSLCTLPVIPVGARIRVTGVKIAGEVNLYPKPWEGLVLDQLRRNEDGTYSGGPIDAGLPGGELGISRCMVELISLPTETAWIPRMPIYARAGAKKGENVPVAGEGWGGYAIAGEDIAANDAILLHADGTAWAWRRATVPQKELLQAGYGPAPLLATAANPSAKEVGFRPIEGERLAELRARVERVEEQLRQAGYGLIVAGTEAGAIGRTLARRIEVASRAQKDDPMKIRVDTTEAEAKLDRLKEKADAAAEATERARAAAEKLEVFMSDQTPTRTEKALAVLSADAADAGYRIAGRQLVKLTREPLVAYLRGKGVDSATIAAMTAFLDTEIGRALWAGLVGAGLSALPQGEGALGEVAARLARELRVSSLAGAGDVVADLLSEPLRRVVSDYLSAHPEAAPLGSLPAEIPRVRAPEVVHQETAAKAGAR